MTDAQRIQELEELVATLRQQQAETPRAVDRVQPVTRLEVIDEGGRLLTRRPCRVDLSFQDEGRTLKVFVKGGETQPCAIEALLTDTRNLGTALRGEIDDNARLTAQLAEIQQARDRLASDLFDEQHQHHWTRDYLKGAEAQLVTLQASLRSLVDKWETVKGVTFTERCVVKACAKTLAELLPPLEARR